MSAPRLSAERPDLERIVKRADEEDWSGQAGTLLVHQTAEIARYTLEVEADLKLERERAERLHRLLLEARGWLAVQLEKPAQPFLDEVDADLAVRNFDELKREVEARPGATERLEQKRRELDDALSEASIEEEPHDSFVAGQGANLDAPYEGQEDE